MNRERVAKGMRFVGCAALLGLLVMSSYTAAKPQQVPSVPVMAQVIPGEMLAGATLTQTKERLERQRERTLAILQSVIDDPRAQKSDVSAALEKKTQIAGAMEKEAAVSALLTHMGFGDTAVIMGESALHIVAPWQAAENEQSRMRMIDAAVSQSGISAQSVKIILAKNE